MIKQPFNIKFKICVPISRIQLRQAFRSDSLLFLLVRFELFRIRSATTVTVLGEPPTTHRGFLSMHLEIIKIPNSTALRLRIINRRYLNRECVDA